MDHGIDELCVYDVSRFGDFEDGTFCESIDVWLQGADSVREFDGEHGQDAIDKVGGVAPLGCFLVDG